MPATTTAGAEIVAFLEQEAPKGSKDGWLARTPDRATKTPRAGTHPEIYRLYKEYVASGRYPYLDDVQIWITDQLPELPPFDRSAGGHQQTNPVQRQLQSEIYVASCHFRAEREQEERETLAVEGWLPVADATVEPDRMYLLRRGTGDPVQVRPVFRGDTLWGFLPPRKRTHGWSVLGLACEDRTVYVKPV
jgi:hypothetical protein